MNQAVLVERVVAEVMRRLMAGPHSCNDDSKATNLANTNSTLVDAVITESLLVETVKGSKLVEVGAKSIVTPAAKDWLRRNNVELRRVAVSSQLPTRRVDRLVIRASNAASIKQISEELTKARATDWRVETGSATESIGVAIKAIATEGITTVVILADEPEVVACQANRNESVKAAVVASIVDIERVQKSLKPNVFVIAPGSKGAFEILRMIRVLGRS